VLSTSGELCYAYYDPHNLDKLDESIRLLDRYITAEGPFHAVLGFSGGAVLVAMYLRLRYSRSSPIDCKKKVPFKCGIFLSSASCHLEGSLAGADDVEADMGLIGIPTLHVWGSKDSIAPNGGKDVSNMCDPAQRQILVHDGGHEVPRQDYLVESVHAIRRTLALADGGSGTKVSPCSAYMDV